MSNDPYGFPPAPNEAPPQTAPLEVLWLAVAATLCTSIGICACYLPYFVGAPLGAWAAWRSFEVVSRATDERDRAIGNASLMMGLVSAAVSGMFALFILAYVMIFALYFVAVLALAGAGFAASSADPAGGDTGAVAPP